MAGREYKIADFTRIVISGDFDVEISRNMLKHDRVCVGLCQKRHCQS